MKIVVAPDSFKESLSAIEVAEAIEFGLRLQKPFKQAEILKIPMSDGGEGFLKCVVRSLPITLQTIQVRNPLEETHQEKHQEKHQETHQASLGMLKLQDKNTAFIEVAEACGLHLILEHKRKPLESSTLGVGELILKALELNCQEIIIGLGGSATIDAGMGALVMLGVQFKDAQGALLEPKGSNLEKIASINTETLDPRLKECHFILAHDVDSPLLGSEGAEKYAAQKGASAEDIKILSKGLEQFVQCVEEATGKNIGLIRGAGAAGGLAAGLFAFLPAILKSGAEVMSEMVGLEEKLRNATLVVTGEGQMDEQTIHGKAPIAVAAMAKKQGIPVIAIVGSLGKGFEVVYKHGIDAVFSIANKPLSRFESQTQAKELIIESASNIARLLALNLKI